MGRIVTMDAEGHIIYDGMLSSHEKATVDEILAALKKEIPQIEDDLEKAHGKSVWYKYYLGAFLGELLKKYDITVSEQRRFWDEIKVFATQKERKRDEGVNSVNRSFYQQCFILSQQDKETAEKLSWRQWQSLLDRVSVREDTRIFKWIRQKDIKFREDDWREFEKALHLYLKNKDTSVFSDEELFKTYDALYSMGVYWVKEFQKFSKEFPKSAKIKTKAKRSKKYQETCLKLRREQKKDLDESIFAEAFKNAMA